MAEPWPTEIRLSKDRRTLTVSFEDGPPLVFTAEFLRVQSPSAEVQGHSPDQRKVIGGKAGVEIERLEPVGHYAIRPTFSDGHATGLFSWSYLRTLGDNQAALWSRYLVEIAERGLSRS